MKAQEIVDFELEGGDAHVVIADGILFHVLEYLKGRDVPQIGMWTEDFTGEVDECQICHGESGGVLGNENLINGVRVCDYCHARMLSGLIDEPTWDGNGPTPYVTVIEKPKTELVQIAPADANCVTLPNGDCVSEQPCMHTEKPVSNEPSSSC